MKFRKKCELRDRLIEVGIFYNTERVSIITFQIFMPTCQFSACAGSVSARLVGPVALIVTALHFIVFNGLMVKVSLIVRVFIAFRNVRLIITTINMFSILPKDFTLNITNLKKNYLI